MKKISTKEWQRIKEEVFKRDDYKCQVCKRTNKIVKLEVHHIDGELKYNNHSSLYKNNNLDNLVILCHKCHSRIHGLAIKAKERKRISQKMLKLRDEFIRWIWKEKKSELSMKEISNMFEDTSKQEIADMFKIDVSMIYQILKEEHEKKLLKRLKGKGGE